MYRLTAETYETIVASLRSDRKGGQSEKRGQPRVGPRVRIEIAPQTYDDAGAQPIAVWLRDISMGGLGLMRSRPMATGMHFVAGFKRDDSTTLNVHYVVANCRLKSKGLYSVGATVEQTVEESKN